MEGKKRKLEEERLFKNPNHLINLNNMRLSGKMCDVTIQVNKREFRAHKLILAANLKYFESMFSKSFQESKQDVVTMQNVEATDLEVFICFAYTGEILLTNSNALGLLQLANYLNEDVIKEACIDFLVKNLKKEDACRAYKFANSIECLSLKNASRSILLSHLEYCSQTAEYFEFDCENLKEILCSANLASTEAQKIFFESVLRWIMYDARNRHICSNELLDIIQVLKLSGHYFLKYLHNYIENQDYDDIVKNVMSFYNKKGQEIQQTNNLGQRLMIIGAVDRKLQVQFYDFTEKKWCQLREIIDFSPHTCLKGTILHNKFYYISYKIKNGRFSNASLQVFNPSTKENTMLSSDSRLLRGGSAVCSCSGFLYLCGGEEIDGSKSDQLLRYDPQKNSFEILTPMKTKRWVSAAMSYRGCIHVLGGIDGSRFLSSVEKYDPVTKQWTGLPSMHLSYCGNALAILDGNLYTCGGIRNNSVEVYKPSANSWQIVASMNKERNGFLVVIHEGKLLAIGGDKGKTVEVYDPNKNQWQMDPKLSSGLQIKYPQGGLISLSCIDNAD